MFSRIKQVFCSHWWFQKFNQKQSRTYLECLKCGKETKGIVTGEFQYSTERPEHGGTWESLKLTA